MSRKYFGTDGIRGEYGVEPLTPEFFKILGFAIGKSLLSSKNCEKKVIFGQDTRESCQDIIEALSVGLLEADCLVYEAGVVPTPAISYFTKEEFIPIHDEKMMAQRRVKIEHFDLGIMVSASHNLYKDNGIKIFNNKGFKISKEDENHIEDYIDSIRNKDIKWSFNETTLKSGDDEKADIRYIGEMAIRGYIDFCSSTMPKKIEKTNLTLDLANGSNWSIGEAVFIDAGFNIEAGFNINVINNTPNGKNINEKCGSTYLNVLPKIIKKNNSKFGISVDGDGDRIVIVNKEGKTLDGDDILYTIIRGKILEGESIRGVVGTVMTNRALENFLNEENIDFIRANVGDKNVLEKMIENKYDLGGETSGHILMLKLLPSGDSMIAALQFLYYSDILEKNNINNFLDKYPQKITNLLGDRNLSDNISNIVIKKAIDKFSTNKLRLVIRKSGTENCIRIMVEAKDSKVVEKISYEIGEFIKYEVKKLS